MASSLTEPLQHGQQRGVLAPHVAGQQPQPVVFRHVRVPDGRPRQGGHLSVPHSPSRIEMVGRPRRGRRRSGAAEDVVGGPSCRLDFARLEQLHRHEGNVVDGIDVRGFDAHEAHKFPVHFVVLGLPAEKRQRQRIALVATAVLVRLTHPGPQHVSDRFHPCIPFPKSLVRRHACKFGSFASCVDAWPCLE